MRQCEEDKVSQKRKECQRREANVALSHVIIHEDPAGKDETPVPGHDEKLPAKDVSPDPSDAAQSLRPLPQISRKRQREPSCESRDPSLKESIVDTSQRDSTDVHSPYSESATAPLEYYIRLASKSMSLPTPSDSYFTSPEHAPVLHRNRENKIIMYTGSFNPPHLGHFELAFHTFLRSSSTTIAVVFLPFRDKLKAKDGAMVNGKVFATEKEQRIALLQNDLLQRWTWFHRGHRTDFEKYGATLIKEAKKDGFQVSFVVLAGSDKFEREKVETKPSWLIGWGEIITSDITRPSSLFKSPERRETSAVNAEARIMNVASLYGFKSTAVDMLLWKANRMSDQSKTVCYMQFCGRDTEGHEKREEVSSSAIRKILSGGGNREEMSTKLEKVMMNPELLLHYLESDG
ncbi:uncharacterized protein J4E92_006482 [Alternaria infectoria]|uniref:uncharacterized protein n=1 Tax=Alternaria infectoria TaxID=45303 RepID=UPI00221E60B0|nr:uncharacterized protein J4E92_006482 [Alternaria infectoria]KAI4925746.1 hypothetical protein J4E92_006482 [Alternaria infectoria]